VITPEGPFERLDFENLAKAIDPLTKSKGKLAGLMIYTNLFPGWESFGAVCHICGLSAAITERLNELLL
jgi:hypothetical protein